ncbi:MAG: class I SAM-dependent methyltransferase [Pseudolabrys sp.]
MNGSLDRYRLTWDGKPLLRRIYNDIYDRIAAACVRGTTLEIGGGIGQFKSRFPGVIATDIQSAPWLDLVTDAQKLPFAAGSIANIVMVDVLHHIEFPLLFLQEAERVLAAGGRLVMAEPAITWGSSLFYRLLHHEPVRMGVDPLTVGRPDAGRDPYDSNQAIPTLLASRDRKRLAELLPSLRVVRTDWFSLWVYPLSGGFKPWSLLPDRVGGFILGLERKLEPVLGRFFAFRLLTVMEKQ